MTDRRSFIGGSDAASVVGKSPYKSALQLYFEKRGEVDPAPVDNEAVTWGKVLEAPVLAEYARRAGAVIVKEQERVSLPDFPFAAGTLDAVATVNGQPVVVEVKTAGIRQAKEWGEADDDVPMHYLLQVHHYLALTRFEAAHIALLLGGQEFRLYKINRDAALSDLLMRKEAEFWRMVQDGTPPDALQTEADQRLRWGVDKGQSIEADSEAVKMHGDLMDVRFRIRELEDREGMLKALLMAKMGEASALMHGGKPLVTWKTQTANRLDQKALKEAHPELVSQFTRESSIRTFLPKKA